MKYTIDRLEGNFAVVELESKKYVNIPRDGIPKEAKDGDIIDVTVDKQATAKKKKDIDDAVKDMWIE
jgi:hypothetical protein